MTVFSGVRTRTIMRSVYTSVLVKQVDRLAAAAPEENDGEWPVRL